MTLFVLLLCAVTTTSDMDNFSRKAFGHPGNLGVTSEAEKYFTENTSVAEAVATIGELATPMPSTDGVTKIYSWQDGKLEMQFRGDRLTKYRLNGKSKFFALPLDDVMKRITARAQQQQQQQSTSKIEQPTPVPDRQQEFRDFQQRVEKIVRAGSQVTQNNLEQTDIQALRFHLAKLNQAIDAYDWKRAEEIRNSMKISLQRSQGVAIDADRRLTERQRADDERRHDEEMRQRERHHQEELRKQQAILDEMRKQRGF
jgi:hypothetical protein